MYNHNQMPDIFINNEVPTEAKKDEPGNPNEEVPAEVEIKPETTKLKEQRAMVNTSNLRLLRSYIHKPDHVKFETMHPDEVTHLLLRSHYITNFKWILVTVIMLFVPIAISIFPVFRMLPWNYDLVIIISWYLITFAYVFEN